MTQEKGVSMQRRQGWVSGLVFFILWAVMVFPLHAGPRMEIGERVYTFDALPEGVVIHHRFPIRNTGDAELRILRVNPG
jgi:hypothetical protein